jgi:hypothetical protein
MQKPERPAHKIFSLAVKELRKYFLPPHEEMLLCSTYFRMFYLSQPITGLLTKTSQLFSGRVTFQLSICTGWTINEYPAIANTFSLAEILLPAASP